MKILETKNMFFKITQGLGLFVHFFRWNSVLFEK